MRDRERWRSLAEGFFAGFLGGEIFLAAGLLRQPVELFATSPTPAFAVWVLLRSVALYGLLAGLLGLALGALLGLAAILLRRRLPAFALTSGAAVAATALAYLTAWWQLDVLAGLPIDDRQRLAAGLWHAAAAAAAGLAWIALLARRARRRPRPAAPPSRVLALAVAALALLGACELGLGLRPAVAEGPWRPSRVVLVGLDGVTFRVLSPMLRRGELPAFRRLIDEGAWGTFLTYGAASSPVVWTTVATGRKARDHGITDFVAAGEPGAGYRARTVRSFDRRVPAVWNVLSRAGRTVAVVDWLVTSPPETVNGVMVSGLLHRRGLRSFPGELAPELEEVLGAPPAAEDGDAEAHQRRRIDRVFAAAGHLLASRDPDLLALYERSADNVGHRLWKHYRPAAFDAELWDLDPAAAARLGGVIPATYAHLDRRLGELLDRLDDETLLIVASDHGQRAARRPRVRLDLDRVLVALGFAAPRSETRALDGGLDYGRSRAYTQTTTRFAPRWRVNLNLAGREPWGIVAAAEAPELRRELVRRLREVRMENGAPLFAEVAAGDDPRRDGAPEAADVLVTPSRYARHHRYLGSRLRIGGESYRLAELAEAITDVSGDHDRQGVLFLHGRGVRRGPVGQRVATTALQEVLRRLTDRVDGLDPWLPVLGRLGLVERATTLDLTPTVLHGLGLPAARDMAGRPLAELLAAGEPSWVDSYDGLLETGPEPEDDGANDEVLERLKALGYVD